MTALAAHPSCASTNSVVAPRARILVVDDQPEIGQFLSQILDVIGHEAVSETNPQNAIGRLLDEHFDVVISDFKMPEMNGLDFYYAVVSAQPDYAARFVFLTGDLGNLETEALLNAVGVPLLGKPFRIDTVEQVVGNILAKDSHGV